MKCINIEVIKTCAFKPSLDIKSFIKDRNERIRCQKLNRERECKERK